MIKLYLITQLCKIFCYLTVNEHEELFIYIFNGLIYQDEFGKNVSSIDFRLQRIY